MKAEAQAKGGHLTVQDMENMQADFDRQAQALSGALEKSFEADGPSLVVIPIDYDENNKLTQRMGELTASI